VHALSRARRADGGRRRARGRPAGRGEDLSSPYLDGDELDLHAWARDALALALPAQIVCRDECRGLCPECGENLNEAAPEHGHEAEPDPRWAALRELRLE
jgi:Predicted metal-binding, possibly nucleic acid-binding protein